jgi:hypothetical protein
MTTSTTGLRKILAENPPKYCRDCGSDLMEASEEAGFDAYTGEQVHKIILTCSKNKLRWFEKPLYDHDEWLLRGDNWYLQGQG